jgi:hypothetical protein
MKKILILSIIFFYRECLPEIKDNYADRFPWHYSHGDEIYMAHFRASQDVFIAAVSGNKDDQNSPLFEQLKNRHEEAGRILDVGNALHLNSFDPDEKALELAIEESSGVAQKTLKEILDDKKRRKFQREFSHAKELEESVKSMSKVERTREAHEEFDYKGYTQRCFVEEMRTCRKELNSYVEENLSQVADDFYDVVKAEVPGKTFINLLNRTIINTCINNQGFDKINPRLLLKPNYPKKSFDEEIFLFPPLVNMFNDSLPLGRIYTYRFFDKYMSKFKKDQDSRFRGISVLLKKVKGLTDELRKLPLKKFRK